MVEARSKNVVVMKDLQGFIKVPVNHRQTVDEGIYNITADSFNEKLSAFLLRFSEIQAKEKNYQLPFHLYQQFPDVAIPELSSEIFTRKQDLQILRENFQYYLNSQKNVLEIGGWNGWLTNRLSDMGAKVVTADIFDDEKNGLRSKKHYKNNNWLSVQTDLLDTSIYNSKFDVIVFNHCLQFLTDPLILIEKYKLLLNDNGALLILGNTFYKNTEEKASEVLKTDQYFKKNYDFNIRFYSSKGFFSYEDFNQFSKNSFKFMPYKFSVPGLIKKFLKKEKSGILYFINS